MWGKSSVLVTWMHQSPWLHVGHAEELTSNEGDGLQEILQQMEVWPHCAHYTYLHSYTHKGAAQAGNAVQGNRYQGTQCAMYTAPAQSQTTSLSLHNSNTSAHSALKVMYTGKAWGHIAKVHEGMENHHCPVCGRGFLFPHQLRRAMLSGKA